MVSTAAAYRTETAASSSTNNNNNNVTAAIVRKPFIQVVQEWATTIEQKLKSKIFQNTTPELPKLALLEDDRKFEDLLVFMDEQENKNAQFLFAAKNGSDAVSLQLFQHLIERHCGERESGATNSNSTEDHNGVLVEKHGGASNNHHGKLKFQWNKIVDKDNANCTLMHICAQRNKPQCMDFLLSHKVAIDSLDSLSSTPLHYAVAQNCQESVVFLLSKGANINAKDSYAKFPLLLALRHKHYAMAELLVSFRPDVHLRGAKGNTVLHFMAEEGDITAVKLLVEKLNASPLRKNNEEENVLYNALPHVEVVQYLATHFATRGLSRLICNTNTSGKSLMHKCGLDGHIDNLLLLLKYMNIGDLSQNQIEALLNTLDKKGDTPLLLAVKNSRREFVRFLVECTEVELNEGDANGFTALQNAVNMSDKEMINSVSKAGGSLKPINRHEEAFDNNYCMNCTRSMGTMLVFMLSFISIICIISMAAISLGFYGSNIRRQTKTARDQSFKQVHDFIDSSISQHTVSSMSAISAFQSNLINTNNDLSGALEFTLLMTRSIYNDSDFTIDAYYGNNKGDQVGVIAFNSASPVDVFQLFANESRFQHNYLPNIFTGSLQDALATTPEFNNASEWDKFGIFYQAANTSRNPSWTLSYAQYSFPGALFMSFITPVYDPVTNVMQSYLGSDISTEALAFYLGASAKEWSSTVVIVERSTGFLLSTSDPDFQVYTNDGSVIERMDGTTGNNELITTMMTYSHKTFGSKMEKVNSGAYGTFRYQGRVMLLNIGEFKDNYGLDWLILQAVPRDLFFKDFKIAIGTMVGLTFVLLIAGVVISIVASIMFMAPLKRLSALAETIKLLRLEEVERKLVSDVSYFSEIRSLQRSFGSMSLRLKQFRQFIPDHILAVIETEVAHKEILRVETLSASIKKGSSKESSLKKGEVELNTISDSVSDTRFSSHSANYHSKGLIANALTSGLVSGTVSVLTLEFDDLSELLESYSSTDVNDAMKDLLNAVKDRIKESNAQLVSHTHSQAVIAWNTLISQPDHRTRATKTAVGCQKAILALQEVWRMKGLPLLDVQIGLSSGPSFYGNIGSDATKIFTVIGRSASLSSATCKLNKSWGTRIICSHDIYQAVKDSFFLRPLDTIGDDTLIYELGEARNTDEWTQELSQEVSRETDLWFDYSRAYKFYEKREYDQAYEIFSDYLSKHPYDVVAQKMVDRSRRMTENQFDDESSKQ